MSLDIWLTVKNQETPSEPRIFIREDGQNKQITMEEWRQRYPDREPVVIVPDDSGEVYSANITHNLNQMAVEAGIYEWIWRPDEIGITKAGQLILALRTGLDRLEREPERFKQFESPNGWGSYDGFVRFVGEYLRACEEWPDAEISVSR